MTTTARSLTAEELLAMGERAHRLELHQGELRPVSPANARHGDIAGQIAMILRQFVAPRKLGKILVEAGYILARKPDTVLGPDVSFLRQSRIPPTGLPEKFFDGHPDLAIEIISPTNPRAELEAKMRTYVDHGTPLAWLVHPAAQTLDIYQPHQRVRQLTHNDAVTGQDVLPEFSCAVAEFFA